MTTYHRFEVTFQGKTLEYVECKDLTDCDVEQLKDYLCGQFGLAPDNFFAEPGTCLMITTSDKPSSDAELWKALLSEEPQP